MDLRSQELLEAALSYAARGWAVVALHNPVKDLSCSCGRAECTRDGKAGKHPRTLHGLSDGTSDPEQIRRWWESFPLANIGIRTGAVSGFFVLDVDERHGGDDSLQGLKEEFGGIPQTVCSLTGAGEHLFFEHPGSPIQNSASKLAQGLDIRGDGGYIIAPPSLHPSGRLYAWEGSGDPREVGIAKAPPWLLSALRAAGAQARKPSNGDGPHPEENVPEGSRDNWLASMAGTMRRRGFTVEAIMAALSVENEKRCVPPKDPLDVRRIAYSIGRYTPGDPQMPGNPSMAEKELADGTVEADWPELPEKALHGLAGEVVRALDPYTEADRAGVLGHFLVYFGNCGGPSAHYRVLSDRHPAKLFAVFVGRSYGGKKGSAHSVVQLLFEEGVDAPWVHKCIQWGTVSGESLVRAFEPEMGVIKEPRLMLRMAEFSSFLKAASREGSTLSGTTCEAWDSDRLKLLRSTKKNSLQIEGSHISIAAHVTPNVLLKNLGDDDSTNGFLNRFLWFRVRESKEVPIPRMPPREILAPLAKKVLLAVSFASETGPMSFDKDAEAYWTSIYSEIGRERPGMAGLATSRARPQILRLSLIYALLDLSSVIRREHIDAARALFSFTVKCSRGIFGQRLGNPLAQRILDFLRDEENGRLSRSEIADRLGRNYSGRDLDAAFRFLLDSEHAYKLSLVRPPGARGPRPEIYSLTKGGEASSTKEDADD